MTEKSLATQTSNELLRLGELLHKSGELPANSWQTLCLSAGILRGLESKIKDLESQVKTQTQLASTFQEQCVKAYAQVDAIGEELTWLREHKPHTFSDYVKANAATSEQIPEPLRAHK